MSERIPEGWVLRQLGEQIEKITSGGTPKAGNKSYYGGRIPFLKIDDITSVKGRYVISSKQTITEEGLSSSSAKIFPAGTVVTTMYGTIGATAILSKPMATNQAIAAFLGLKGFKADYLHQLLKYETSKLASSASQTTQANISATVLKEYEVLVPPLLEQKKIAAILSSVDEVIEKTRAQIDKLKDLKTGMMQELLTKGIGHTEFKDSLVGRIPASWRTQVLGEVFDLKNGVNKDKTAFGHGVPIISYKNVYVGGGITDSNLTALVDMSDKELERFRVRYGDVFFTRTSETPGEIGFANIYMGSRNDVVFNGFVIRGRQKTHCFDPGFLKYAFQNSSVRKQMMDSSKFTTRAGISGESLGKIEIAIPEISEQKAIANALDSIHGHILSLTNKLQAQKSLKKALMQDLLTGKVRVQVDAPEVAEA